MPGKKPLTAKIAEKGQQGRKETQIRTLPPLAPQVRRQHSAKRNTPTISPQA
jgi:hypothetical protein